MKRHFVPFLLILFFSLPFLYALAQGITLVTMDGWAHLFRQVEFDKALRGGQFPPSWAGTAVFGFGNPVFLFNWTLPYYFVEMLFLTGIPLVYASHIFFAVSLIGGSIVLYFFLEKLYGRLPAFLGAIVYLYAPYRLLGVFIYAAWGEILSLFIGPLLIFWVIKVFNKQSRKLFFFGGILTFLLILTHNVMSIMFITMAGSLSVFLFLYYFFSSSKQQKIRMKRFLLVSFLGMVIGILLTVYFWVPAILNKNLIYAIDLAGWPFRIANYKTFESMILVGKDTLLGTRTYYTSFTIGLPILLIVVLAVSGTVIKLFGVIRKKLESVTYNMNFKTGEIISIWAIIVFLVSLYLTMPVSEPVWAKLPVLQLFLYPYRFIAGMTVSGAILAAYVLSELNRGKILFTLLFVPLVVLAGWQFIWPKIEGIKVDSSYFYLEQPSYFAPGNWISLGNEDFLPKWIPKEFLRKLQKEGKPKEMYNVQSFDSSTSSGLRTSFPIFKKISESKSSNKAEFKFIADGDGVLTANIFYFPGWRVWDNGKEINTITPDNNGRITFPITKGEHAILMKFTDTPIHSYSKIFSLFAFLGFLGLGVWGKRLKLFTS